MISGESTESVSLRHGQGIQFNSSTSGPLMAPTKSQTMNLRLVTTVSPLHDTPVLSSAGVEEKNLHAKTPPVSASTSVANLLDVGSVEISKPSASAGALLQVEDENNEDDDVEVEEKSSLMESVTSPLHFQIKSTSNQAPVQRYG